MKRSGWNIGGWVCWYSKADLLLMTNVFLLTLDLEMENILTI